MQQILEGAKHAIMRMPDSRGQILGSQSTNTSSELSTAEQLGLARLHVQLFPGDHIKTLFRRLVSRKEPINPHEALALDSPTIAFVAKARETMARRGGHIIGIEDAYVKYLHDPKSGWSYSDFTI